MFVPGLLTGKNLDLDNTASLNQFYVGLLLAFEAVGM